MWWYNPSLPAASTETGQQLVKTVTESLEIGEFNSRHTAFYKAITEDEQILETIIEDLTSTITDITNENINISESNLVRKSMVRIITEDIEISETDLFPLSIRRIINDTENILESVIRHADLSIIITENLDIHESRVNHKDITQLFNESINFEETLFNPRSLVRTSTSNLDLLESSLAQKTTHLITTLNEDVEFSETVIINLSSPGFPPLNGGDGLPHDLGPCFRAHSNYIGAPRSRLVRRL